MCVYSVSSLHKTVSNHWVKNHKDERDRASGTCGKQERCVQGCAGEPEGKRPLGEPKRRWEDNIKISIQEV